MRKIDFKFICASLVLVLSAFTSCSDYDLVDEEITTSDVSTRAVTSPAFDWETIDRMPSPSNQYISIPWSGQGGLTLDQSIVWDFKKSDGWELLYHTFFTDKGFCLIPILFFITNIEGRCEFICTLTRNLSLRLNIYRTILW